MSTPFVATRVNDQLRNAQYLAGMPLGKKKGQRPATDMTKARQPRRPHYIAEWAAKRGFESNADLARALDVDKSLITRWFRDGTSPSEQHQKNLARLFHCEPESLFRHPDDDWLTRFFRDRSEEEVQRAKAMLEAAFPRKAS